MKLASIIALLLAAFSQSLLMAGVGDPQVRTDHAWYPGELAFSTFERLEKTQAELYERVTGRKPITDQDRVLASWLWRNTHFAHGEEGLEDLWGKGFQNNTDNATRDYWTGLFAHGFGLCGTTHAQWTAEIEHLLGHNRARVVGVTGHNSFEVFLKEENQNAGRWALLDHDLSTVIFDEQGNRLLSIAEISKDVNRWTRKDTSAPKQQGWLVCGLHPDDGSGFDTFKTAEYLAGYAGPSPMVHLRRGETLRRYLAPGLEDGKTYVFWGRNYNAGGIPGPERSRTWVNQPEKMHGSREGTGYKPGQARFANAVSTYRPDFKSEDYREGVIEESADAVTFEFHSPYIIAATPLRRSLGRFMNRAARTVWSSREKPRCGFRFPRIVDALGKTAARFSGKLDLTDFAKGHRQYWIRFHAGAKELRDAELSMTTVCQANAATMPRLADNGSRVEFAASGKAIVSAGPNLPQAEAALVAGAFDSPRVTLELAAPRKASVVGISAAAHVASSNPPSPDVKYQIEYSTDNEKSWQNLIKDWRITRQGEEPKDFWSQSFCWGSVELDKVQTPVRVRFSNDGGKRYRRAELHLAYQIPKPDACRVTFGWSDDKGQHAASNEFPSNPGTAAAGWQVPTSQNVQTQWVEYGPVIR